MAVKSNNLEAVKADLIQALYELDSGSHKKWDAAAFLAECKVKATVKNISKTIYFSNSAWEFLKKCMQGFDKSETGLVTAMVNDINKQLDKKPKEWLGTKQLKPVKEELKLLSFGFDVFTVFYRVKNGSIEIAQFVDDDELQGKYASNSANPKSDESAGRKRFFTHYRQGVLMSVGGFVLTVMLSKIPYIIVPEACFYFYTILQLVLSFPEVKLTHSGAFIRPGFTKEGHHYNIHRFCIFLLLVFDIFWFWAFYTS